MNQFIDQDPQETQEWLDALDAVIRVEGEEKAMFLLHKLAAKTGFNLSSGSMVTPYRNTIPPEESEKIPGDSRLGMWLAAYIRWNAMAMVVRANKKNAGIGGHISSFASSGTLYEIGFNYFFKGYDAPGGNDLIFFQGHTSPGIYGRAFVEGRLSEEQLINFRHESAGNGLPSYPHPRLLSDFWQFPTVSMGLGPIMAIYQARFMRYLENRNFRPRKDRKIWVFLGDGETDEPETLGVLGLAAREKLDNLIFVVNCNLQRLDGPVRGNGKIVQELEGVFRGAGWNVIKVLWGSEWDELFARDDNGVLARHLESIVDGDFQRINAHSRDGAYVREHLFNRNPQVKEMVKDWSDEQLSKLSRGGHDPRKVYAAFAKAVKHQGQPTVLLVQTVKGYGQADAGEGTNDSHNQKTMDEAGLKQFRDHFKVEISDEDFAKLAFIKPKEGSPVYEFLHRQRRELGGYLPMRKPLTSKLEVPKLDFFSNFFSSSGERKMSTTMAFVRILSSLLRNKDIGRMIVPIIPDEARTFGMEGLFKQVGIFAPFGQSYTPVDSKSLMWYRESTDGQILQEGISEAGAFCSWLAAATSYANHGIPMLPFFIFYSMFGFQRIGDLAWAAGDLLAKGFLIGGTAGRTTLNGEGLQHQDGHSLLMAGNIPSCLAYDPCFAYEMAVIIQDGIRRMYYENESIFYYITAMNENYSHPEMPDGVEDGIRKGMYLFKKSAKRTSTKVQLMGSGAILREVIAAAELLEKDFNVAANVWSAPGVNQLYRNGMEVTRWNAMNPAAEQRQPYVSELLANYPGPVIASTDYVRAYVEQLSSFVNRPFYSLGTDGFGRSDSREALRSFFEVDRYYIVLTALKSLIDQGKVAVAVAEKAIKKYNLSGDKVDPMML